MISKQVSFHLYVGMNYSGSPASLTKKELYEDLDFHEENCSFVKKTPMESKLGKDPSKR